MILSIGRNLANKVLAYKTTLKPVWTYGIPNQGNLPAMTKYKFSSNTSQMQYDSIRTEKYTSSLKSPSQEGNLGLEHRVPTTFKPLN